MALSKKLLAVAEELKNLKQTQELKLEKHPSEQASEQLKMEESQQIASPLPGILKSGPKEENTKATKTRKKKSNSNKLHSLS